MTDTDGLDVLIDPAGDSRVVRIEGELSIGSVERVRAALIDGMEKGKTTVLDLAGIQAADLCGLQLLCSAHRTYAAHGAVFEVRSMCATLRDTAHAAGYDADEAVCAFRRTGNCLWKR